MKHLEWFSPNCAARFMEMVTPTRLVVYGIPSLQVKDVLAAFSPIYIVPFGSFKSITNHFCTLPRNLNGLLALETTLSENL